MAVYNDSYDNDADYKADLAWEYRKGGPNDPEIYEDEDDHICGYKMKIGGNQL